MEPQTPSTGGGASDGSSGISTTSKEKLILQKLLFDEAEFFDRLEDTVTRALRFFKIEPQTGRVVLLDEAQRRRVIDQIRLYVAGRYFAWRIGVLPTDKVSYREIATALNRPASGVSPEVTDLVREGDLVRAEEGVVSMPFHRIDGILREMEQSAPTVAEADSSGVPARRATSRVSRPKNDPVLQSMLEKAVDLSAYAWVRNLPTARDKGLAALHIASAEYSVEDMTCAQMETFLTRTFPVKVTRAAINMGLLGVKSQYVAPIARGAEIAYRLLPLGREYVLNVAREVQQETQKAVGPEDEEAQSVV